LRRNNPLLLNENASVFLSLHHRGGDSCLDALGEDLLQALLDAGGVVDLGALLDRGLGSRAAADGLEVGALAVLLAGVQGLSGGDGETLAVAAQGILHQVQDGAAAVGDGRAATLEVQALVLGESVALAANGAGGISADGLSEGAGSGGGAGGRGDWDRGRGGRRDRRARGDWAGSGALVLDEVLKAVGREGDGAHVEGLRGVVAGAGAAAVAEGLNDEGIGGAVSLVAEGSSVDASTLLEGDGLAALAVGVGAVQLLEGALSRWGRRSRGRGLRSRGGGTSLLDGGGGGVRCDQALIATLGDTDVASLTPAWAPGVLDDPVRGGVGIIEANNEDTVVDLVGDAVGQDSTSVGLEGGGVDGNGQRSVVVHEGGHVVLVLGDIDVSVNLSAEDLSGEVAGGDDAISRDIGVRSGSDDLSVLVGEQPLEGVLHQTTVAALVNGVARDELLLGEGGQVVTGEEPLALNASGGGERPARSALALILDVGDGTLGTPVNAAASGGLLLLSGELELSAALSDCGLEVSIAVVVHLELLGRHVGVRGGTEGGLGVDGLEGLSSLHVLNEVVEALHLLGGRVGLAVLGLELSPHGGVVSTTDRGDGQEHQ